MTSLLCYQTLAATPLMIATRRIRGEVAVQGIRRAALAGLAAAAIGSAVGGAVSIAVPVSHKLLAAGVAVLAAGCTVIVFGIGAYFLDDGDLRTVLIRLRQITWLRRIGWRQAA